MEPNELRIDNLILGPDKETICAVKYIDGEEQSISTDKYSERPAVDFYSIPLTEEWLLKFGFERDNYCSYDNVFSLNNSNLALYNKPGTDLFQIHMILENNQLETIPFRYVHQPRNNFSSYIVFLD